MRKLFLLLLIYIIIMGKNTQSEILKEVDIVGCKLSQKEMLIAHSGLEKGKELHRRDIQNAVKNLWKTGLFSDISIEAIEILGGVKITIKVDDLPVLNEYEIKGNEKIDDDDIKKELNLVSGMVISPSEVAKGAQKIYEMYKEKGYLQAKIETEFDYIGKDSLKTDVLFRIKEGEKVKVKKVLFYGNENIKSKKLRGKMKTKADNWFRSGEFKEEEYAESKDNIVKYYQEKGYKNAYIVRDSLSYSDNLKDLFIHIYVHEGDRYKIGNITFEGNNQYEDKILKKVIKFQSDDWYNVERYNKSIEEIMNIYREKGYLYVDIQDQILIDSNRLNINFIISEKEPVTVQKVLITGNTKTKEKVIRREIILFPGEIYRNSRMMRSFRNIMQLNFFANVVPDVQMVDNKNVNVVFSVEEKPTGQISMGAGWSERDRLVGTFAIGIPNFMGNGQLVDLSIDYGRYRKNYRIGFTEPWLFDTPTQAGFELRKQTRYWENAFDQEVKGFSIWTGRRLTWPDDYFSASVRYRLDEQEYKNISDSFNDIYGLRDQEGALTTSSITLNLTRSSVDKPEFPNSGSINSFSYELAGGILGGSYRYHKEVFKSYWYFPTIAKFILGMKMTFGHIDSYDTDREVPYVEKFLIGGTAYDGQVRGYEDLNIMTVDNTAGKSMLVFNIEYTVPVVENQIYALGFMDAGNVWNSMKRTNFFDLKKSAGFGVRIVIPLMGTIGFDFGYGFDADSPGWQPHFQVGRSF